MRRWVAPILVLAGLVAAWQIAVDTGVIDDFLVPAPNDVARALWENRSLLADNAWVTFREVVLGFACAVVLGLAFAVALHLSGVLRQAVYPLLVASQTIPIVVAAPLFVLWFGFGIGPKLAIVALVCFFPITVNTLDGLRSADPEQIKMMRSLDASRWQVFRRVEAPGALPRAFTGMKIAVAIAVIGAVFGEDAGATEGLGFLIRVDNAQFETARIFASVLILSGMAILLFGLLTLAERRVVRWS
jgi:putative hydroxymethylpyrimidine transport system permease protein